ncbi:hypothetical protein [Enterocloster alcoholdehydrogenati]|uniref:hypothetical protein n=1 Tax=Enterocloster alcoholdehydrogenati TaxID=2547410 RepID=UPI0015947DF6|nr:hypothetical protein [Enterocloster alcoholdehydrogenati]
MKDTMILKDGTTVELEAGASLAAIQVAAADRTAMLQVWQKLTEENLAEVQIKNGSGLTVGTYTNLMLVSETSTVDADGAVTTTYNLREKSAIEKRLDSVETGQKIQDGAIGDLGETVGAFAEGGEA